MVLLRTACLHSQNTPALRRKVRSFTSTTRSTLFTELIHPLTLSAECEWWYSLSPPTHEQTPFTLDPSPFNLHLHPSTFTLHPSPFTLIASPNSHHLLKSRTLPVCGGTPLDGKGGRSIDRALDLLPPYPASLSQLYSLQSVVVPYFCLDPIFLTQLLRPHHSPIPLSICTPSNSESSPLLSHRAGVACEPVPELAGLA